MAAGWIAFALVLPFFLNDFFFAVAVEAEAWLFVDYATKALVLYAALWLVFVKRLNQAELGLNPLSRSPFLRWTAVLTLLGVAIDQLVPLALGPWFPSWRFFSFPELYDDRILYLDLSFGLALTAVAEEVIFRGLLVFMLLARYQNAAVAVVVSSLLFGLMHWGLGPALVINAFLWGILPALSVIKTRSIYPAVVAHYVTNFVDFSGLGL